MPNPARSRCHQCRMPMTRHTSWCPYSPGKLTEARMALSVDHGFAASCGPDEKTCADCGYFVCSCNLLARVQAIADPVVESGKVLMPPTLPAPPSPEMDAWVNRVTDMIVEEHAKLQAPPPAPQSDEDYARERGWVDACPQFPGLSFEKGGKRVAKGGGYWSVKEAGEVLVGPPPGHPSLRAAIDAAEQAMAGSIPG